MMVKRWQKAIHISENDHTQDPCDYGLVGGYALPALHSILNQKGTENIHWEYQSLYSSFFVKKMYSKHFDVFWSILKLKYWQRGTKHRFNIFSKSVNKFQKS